ncbi:hypothetical protein AB0J86_31385 [Micromonospora sp. NPDC049559]|uniref:hypothetical protein n=1 Tax=Micromonospora sp. NPDC049559 TaxID=3155923 RepID=UPI00342E5D27
MTQRLLYLFSLAGLVAAVVTLVGYLASRDTSFAEFFDDNWEMILLATGVVVLGLLIMGSGVVLFYSVDGAFLPFVVVLAIAIFACGAFLCYLGVSVVLDLG